MWRAQFFIVLWQPSFSHECMHWNLSNELDSDKITKNIKTGDNAFITITFTGDYDPALGFNLEALLTCNSSLSSPITAALFQSMISEKGSSQPLLSITGTQAACKSNTTNTERKWTVNKVNRFKNGTCETCETHSMLITFKFTVNISSREEKLDKSAISLPVPYCLLPES